MSDLLKELSWRGFIYDKTPQIEEILKNPLCLYVGFDPTADSLHVGSLVGILLLKHFQLGGHKPLAIVGGATGMIGDPSGKSAERELLDEETLNKDLKAIGAQLGRFLDFEPEKQNSAELINNYDWMKNTSFLLFAREIGKHLSINYMMSKDSVKKRLDTNDSSSGMSFTEFTYQLLQANDFLELYKTKNCTLQAGGSDQWGNITTGIELIRKKLAKKAHGLTFPLITRSDGTKFGKSASGENIWLDAQRTSPYKFYQFWLNTSDEEAQKFVKLYTFLPQKEIEELINHHKKEPHKRLLQKTLAREITLLVHGVKLYEKARASSEFFFGKTNFEDMEDFDKKDFIDLFEGLSRAALKKEELLKGLPILEALVKKGNFIASLRQAKEDLGAGAIFVNKQKVDQTFVLGPEHLIRESFLVLQKGKKNYFVLEVI